jgi:hypothetical protein
MINQNDKGKEGFNSPLFYLIYFPNNTLKVVNSENDFKLNFLNLVLTFLQIIYHEANSFQHIFRNSQKAGSH